MQRSLLGVNKPLCVYYKFYVKSSDFMNAELCDKNFFVKLLFFSMLFTLSRLKNADLCYVSAFSYCGVNLSYHDKTMLEQYKKPSELTKFS